MISPAKIEPADPAAETALVEAVVELMHRPEFASLLVRTLRATPEFSALFAEKLGMAIKVPAFCDFLSQNVVNASSFLPTLAEGRGTTPFKRLFPEDMSAQPPASYSVIRAADTWSRMFGTVLDFIMANRIEGDLYEFGTFNGYSTRHLAIAMTAKDRPQTNCLHTFDTFAGFPELTTAVDKTSYEIAAGWEAGACATDPGAAGRIRQMLGMLLPPERFKVVEGSFADTLTQAAVPRVAAMIHVDCDLYESTKVVFERMLALDAIQDGTVLVFDDFNCARANPEFGERRAMHETFDAHPRFSCEPWFSYGWHGQVCIVHERNLSRKRGAV